MQQQQLLFTIPETGKIISSGRTKIYQLVSEGELHLVKLGKKSLITWASIKALVEKLSNGAGDDR